MSYIRSIMIWVESRSKFKEFFPKMGVMVAVPWVRMVRVMRVMALLTAIEVLMKVMILAIWVSITKRYSLCF